MLEILLRLKEWALAGLISTLVFLTGTRLPATPPDLALGPNLISGVATSTTVELVATSTPKSEPSKSAQKKNVITPKKEAVPKMTIVLDPPLAPPATLLVSQKPAEIKLLDLTAQNEKIRAATVNILCAAGPTAGLSPISGSGVFIDPRGIILTNAHVGQYYLFDDYPTPSPIECVIRTGSPAVPQYRAELMYISESWIRDNATHISDPESLGTGRYDFALLRVTETLDPARPLPTSFPFIEPNDSYEFIATNQDVILSSYPAELIGSIATSRDLQLISSVGNIQRALYFEKENAIDLFSLGGNIIAQGGSSGGPVANREDGKLMGILVTTTEGKTTDEKDLHAVSLPHISATLRTEIGIGLRELLSFDPAARARSWRELRRDSLRTRLENALSR